MVTYISKSNNIDQQNLTKPGTSEGKTVLLIYNIQTFGMDNVCRDHSVQELPHARPLHLSEAGV